MTFIEEAIVILAKLQIKVPQKEKLSPLIKAVLAQCYGMMAHHAAKNMPLKVDDFVLKSQEKAKEAIQELSNSWPDNEFLQKQVQWISNNAIGISLMFQDDKNRDSWNKGDDLKTYRNRLKESIKFLDKADEYYPDNWAITNNKASVRLRLGHLYIIQEDYSKAEKYFKEAEEHLKRVIMKLRPNYDFAYYELGRIHRFLMKQDPEQKVKALENFQKAIQYGGINPNISVEKINREILAANKGEIAFNLTDQSTTPTA